MKWMLPIAIVSALVVVLAWFIIERVHPMPVGESLTAGEDLAWYYVAADMIRSASTLIFVISSLGSATLATVRFVKQCCRKRHKKGRNKK
jgi:hypothetical protein